MNMGLGEADFIVFIRLDSYLLPILAGCAALSDLPPEATKKLAGGASGFDLWLKNMDNAGFRGEVAEWLMAADCKSALLRVRWFESSPLHQGLQGVMGR